MPEVEYSPTVSLCTDTAQHLNPGFTAKDKSVSNFALEPAEDKITILKLL